MTEREKFENWSRTTSEIRNLERYPDKHRFFPGQYKQNKVQLAWDAWQAATDASTHKAIYEDEVCGD